MGRLLNLGKIAGRGFWRIVLCAVTTSVLASTVNGQPIKYTGFTITDGQLGSWYFHNARVILTFVSDAKYVQSNVPFPPTDVIANLNIKGKAEITIVGDDKTVHATFDDQNQKFFISYDQTNDGIGFGLCSPNCLGLLSVPQVLPSVFQPVYPFGISQLDHGSDLTNDIAGTGRSFSCLDFGMPDSAYSMLCPYPPSVALGTDNGDLYLYQMYQEENNSGEFKSSNAGYFFADTSWSENTLPYTVFAPSTQIPTSSITYNLFFVSDVSIGDQSFSNAKINLSFRSRTSKVQPLAGAGPNAYVNDHGTARVVITSGSQTVSAEFAPGQLYVFFNPNTATVGFGSYAPDGSRQLAYPVILGPDYGISPQLLQDVSDIITNQPNPASGGPYSFETQALAQVTDLKHPTLLADYASSCTAVMFDSGIICSAQAQPAGLMTDKGLFFLPEFNYGGFGAWGAFWSSFNSGDELDD